MKNMIQCNKLKHNQKGAALLMVLLVTAFVVLMGSSVLFTSHSGHLVKLVDRQGLDTFYSTETVLDQMRAQVQDFSSAALRDSYTKTMSEYAFIEASQSDEDDILSEAQNVFNKYFCEELSKVSFDGATSTASREVVEQVFDFVKDVSSSTTPSGERTYISDFLEFEHYPTDFVYPDGFGVSVPSTGIFSVAEIVEPSDKGDFNVTVYEEVYTRNTNGTISSSTKTESTTTSWGIYNASALKEMLQFGTGVTVTSGEPVTVCLTNSSIKDTLEDDRYGYFTLEYGIAGDRLVLHGVTITFEENGYLTNITTDIVIEMPDFVHNGEYDTGYTYEETTFDGVPFENVASIGKYWVKTSKAFTDGLLITGDLYGGVFFIYNENSTNSENIIFSHGGGRLITYTGVITKDAIDDAPDTEGSKPDPDGTESDSSTSANNDLFNNFDTGTIKDSLIGFEVYDGTSFYTRSDSEIWVSGVNVHEGGDMILQGSYGDHDWAYSSGDRYGGVNVAGDLRVYGGLEGNETDFVLTGDYFGFGFGGTAAKDSSILIDGSGVNWGLSYDPTNDGKAWTDGEEKTKLVSLTIAGTSYLNPSGREGVVGSEYALGQSWSTLPDQLAYLVPLGALTGVSSNPAVVVSGEDTRPTVSVNQNYELWSGKTIGNYVTTGDPLVSISVPYTTGYTLIYYFYHFKDTDTNNQYFADYVEANRSTFTNYFNYFVSMDEVAYEALEGAVVNTKGQVYAHDGDGIRIGTQDALNIEAEAAEKAQEFKNASVTLSPNIPIDPQYAGVLNNDENLMNPYDYYVKTELLKQDVLSAVVSPGNYVLSFYNTSGHMVGLYSGRGVNWYGKSTGVAHLSETYEHVSMIVANGGINLQATIDPGTAYNADGSLKDSVRNEITYEGLVMSSVGVAIVSPIISNSAKVMSSLTATTQVVLVDESLIGSTGSFANDYWRYYVKYDDTFTYTEDGTTYTGLEAYGVKFKDVLEERNIDWTYLEVVECTPAFITTADEYVVMRVPFASYFDHLIYTTGSLGDPTINVGATQVDVLVNWGANDLVYFENWEKH